MGQIIIVERAVFENYAARKRTAKRCLGMVATALARLESAYDTMPEGISPQVYERFRQAFKAVETLKDVLAGGAKHGDH